MVCATQKLKKAIGTDTQYSVHALTDEAGSITEGYQYDAYGRQTVFTNSGADTTWFTNDDTQNMSVASAVGNPYGYTGRRFDNETEIWYFRNRYYDSDTGRFVNRDPLGYVDGWNSYSSYFALNGTDPMGDKLVPGRTINKKKQTDLILKWLNRLTWGCGTWGLSLDRKRKRASFYYIPLWHDYSDVLNPASDCGPRSSGPCPCDKVNDFMTKVSNFPDTWKIEWGTTAEFHAAPQSKTITVSTVRGGVVNHGGGMGPDLQLAHELSHSIGNLYGKSWVADENTFRMHLNCVYGENAGPNGSYKKERTKRGH